jgi:hypothetical protein
MELNAIQNVNVTKNCPAQNKMLVPNRLQIRSSGPSHLTFSFHSATDGECNKVLAKAQREI